MDELIIGVYKCLLKKKKKKGGGERTKEENHEMMLGMVESIWLSENALFG